MPEARIATPVTESDSSRAVMASPRPSRSSRRGLDPRTQVALVLASSLVAMSPQGLSWVIAILALGLALAAWERAWGRAAGILLGGSALALCTWAVPLVWPNGVTTTLGIASGYLIRFAAVASVGAHFVATTSPTALAAGLRAWHAPRAIAVTLAVMLRFFPLVASEARAVLDAMRLRGLTGAAGILRHPLRAVERFTVPMIAASLRASEDLSASAILRGLGSRRTPTAMHPPRFGIADAVLVVGVAALVGAVFLAPGLVEAAGTAGAGATR